MSKPTMTKDRFNCIIAAYGASPERWPEAEREAVIAFATSDEPEEVIEARQLDEALATIVAPYPSELLAARILKQAQGQADSSERRVMPRSGLPLRAIAATLAISLGIGMITGQFISQKTNLYTDDVQLALELYDETGFDYTEITQ